MLSVIAALASIAAASAAITADQVTSLPGWKSAMPSKMWSGYLNVDSSTNRNLHYVFFESEAGADAPVVLWLNGGPGCSSMDGAFEENGPFQPQADGTLELRPTRWTQRAHMLYLEAPAGVGFSYSQNPNDYVTNDTKTANDNLRALEVFAKGFPEYMANDFYISGESYAGVYIPTLANAIHLSGTTSIHLKGIMVGNGCTGTEVGTCSAYGDMYRFEYMGAHNLFSMSQLTAINASCTGQWANPGFACQMALSNAADVIGNINIYNIGAGECKGGSPLSKFRVNTPFLNMLHKRSLARSVDSQGPVACIDAGVMTNYLNTPAVTEALHVASASKYWGQWAICSNKLDYTSTAKNLPRDVYPTLVQNYRVLIFNGDYDACVPVIDNELWTQGAAAAQGWAVKSDWHAWVTPENQVAGYATEYSTPGNGSFAFTTVHGSGHMVPQYQPEAALQMFTTYLSGKSL
ncbi:hypothetical protein FNF27_00165 [Cafeteria roenbergensis]|uniref:Carboxypeptidase n=1 Tax=Cafeteria roenbergensis TaxID=33653 RepID=A0A5A8EK98_CAFRO|nr:hypothetical protein FNF31_02442 [Cafeteria roenbergensis]KAA0164972.1 hypothetical protein FNF28_03596 [Cafeteria roenbergensis]KAA0178315.1 hypothetical protein FNF27_00165 [Cafeteria roenbergensis]